MEELHCTVQMSKVSKEYNFLKITVLKKWCEEIKSMLSTRSFGGGAAGWSPLLGVMTSAPPRPLRRQARCRRGAETIWFLN